MDWSNSRESQEEPLTTATPLGWGTDPLTQYLDDARGNQFATFNNKRRAMADLIAIDKMFLKLLHSAVNPDPEIRMRRLAYSAARHAPVNWCRNEIGE